MTHINLRRDTAANWTAENPVLQLGETGWERDTRKVKMGDGSTAWNDLDYIVEPGVDSVNGQTGVVVLDATDVGLGNVDDTPDMDKPVSFWQAAAIADKADLDSPAFTGNPTAPLVATGDSTDSIATTEFVQNELFTYSGAVATLTNKDLTDPTNEFPSTLTTAEIWGSSATNDGPFTTEALLKSVALNAVAGAFYRVTLYCECSNDAGDFTILNLKIDTVSSGTTGTQFAEGLKDHRVSGRRESLVVIGILSTVTGVLYVKATAEGSGAGSTIHGGNTPTLLMVDRIA